MITTILTPDEARQARQAVGLSQNKVAKATGISRTTLALFEVKKYLLDDEQLMTLREYYEGLGHIFSDPTETTTETRQTKAPESPGLRLMDGFAVPEGIDGETVEQILAEYQANENQIGSLLKKRAGTHWFTGEPKEDGINQLQQLMSKNYLLTQQLKGHEIFTSTTPPGDIDPETVTNDVLLYKLLSTGSLD